MQLISVRVPAREIKYEIRIGAGLIGEIGEAGRKAMGPSARRAALISNRRVFDLFGEKVVRALRSSGVDVNVWLMPDGEQHKSMRSLDQALAFFSKSGLERNDVVIALGGGVVGDLAGLRRPRTCAGSRSSRFRQRYLRKSMLRLEARPASTPERERMLSELFINRVWF